MRAVAEAISGLPLESRRHVLMWAVDRFAGGPAGTRRGEPPTSLATEQASLEPKELTYSDIAELYNAAQPSTDIERALVGGYWLQVFGEEPDFTGLQVNTELKNLGHGIGNITQAFSSLMRSKPALVMQVRKTGSARQARKRLKITAEGRRSVEAMLRGQEGD